MGKRDPRVDACIKKAPDFAKPWSAPFLEYKGVLAGMAAFKAHCGLNLWKER